MATPKGQAAIGLQRRFAENAILLRDQAGLSQAMTAERAGLHITEISLIERSLRMPRLDTIVKLAGALEIEACELLVGMEWLLPQNLERSGHYEEDSVEPENGEPS
ncbi:MAG TPA: helix-turn-helix transcriptional regulator [Solirubrobacteraceae bacterium]|nr:helix-turn-helix transcriptional regulator [Solirubrobacteraceae bacterium]